jgi:hypothetical protein
VKLDVKIDKSMLDADGKPDLARLKRIDFEVFRSEYYSSGSVVGQAFSAGRKFLSG